jgi:hypothetical protein
MLCRYTGAANIANLFVFDPRGQIIWASVNNFGATHDATMADELDECITDGRLRVPEGFYVVADAAFGARLTWMRKPLRDSVRHPTLEQVNFSAAVTSVRQAAEWGIASLTRTMHRLRVPLTWNPRWRRKILLLCVYMHNYRARRLLPNQIRTVFSVDYEAPLIARLKQNAFYNAVLM